MSSQYLIDTSVWIDYFRDTGKELNDFIDQLIDNDEVYINGIIKLEILIGTKTKKEYETIKRNLECFHFLELDEQVFNETSRVGFQLKRKGITVPLSDLIIAVQCSNHRLVLIEKDKHFREMKQCLDLTIHSS